MLEEKINSLKKKEEEIKKSNDDYKKKNLELINIKIEKEKIIKKYEIKLKNYEAKSSAITLEIQNYKKKIQLLEDYEKKMKEKATLLLEENKKDKDRIAKLEKEKTKIGNDNLNNNNYSLICDNINEKTKLIKEHFAQQSEEYKRELKNIKTEFKIELEKKCKEIIKNKLDDTCNNIYKEIYEQNEILLNNYLGKLEEFENKRKDEISQMINASSITFTKNETMHEGIKCNNCGKKPIFGERYQCSKCPKYNLCKQCEEENSITLKHNHNFIKIRYAINDKELEKNNKDNNEEKKEENINIEKKYSIEIKDIKEVYSLYYKNKKYHINLEIKNNGELEYPEGAEIKCDEKSQIKSIKKIKIKALKPNETQQIKIDFEDIIFPQGAYKSIFNFQINGKNYGKKIIINLKIFELSNFELVEEFKNAIKDFYEIKFENKTIVNALRNNNCDLNLTLDYLISKKDLLK